MSDIISRADAIEALCHNCAYYTDAQCKTDSGYWCESGAMIREALPSAEAVKVAYICDGRKCDSDCSECFRTLDIEHARDFTLMGDTYFQQEAEAVQGWIPCSKRLPRTGDDILVTFSDGEVDIIISARPKAWVKYEEANNLIFPVAWMPLPKPYKGGEDE